VGILGQCAPAGSFAAPGTGPIRETWRRADVIMVDELAHQIEGFDQKVDLGSAGMCLDSQAASRDNLGIRLPVLGVVDAWEMFAYSM
jgi:hypothetical protein